MLVKQPSSLDECKLVALQRIEDPRGCVTVVEESPHFPFGIKRVYYVHDVNEGAARGGHAHKQLHQLLIAAHGRFVVALDNGSESREFVLDNPSQGLYLAPGVWREMKGFSSGAVCLVLASHGYDESDYIRNYQEYQLYIQSQAPA